MGQGVVVFAIYRLTVAMMNSLALTLFSGRAGDRNDRAIPGARMVAEALSAATGLPLDRVGTPQSALAAGWEVELAAARPGLLDLQRRLAASFAAGDRPFTTMGRCAAGLGTLPAVAAAHPEFAIVWFDAHGDCNAPQFTTSFYLGGMILTGAAGRWETGLGAGLDLGQVVLVGARDLDPCEKDLIDSGTIRLVEAGPNLADRLRKALAGRKAYLHLDCDVLNPGLVPTEYEVANGLSFEDLHDACAVLAEAGVVGAEIAEFEATWRDGRPGDPAPLVSALAPLFR